MIRMHCGTGYLCFLGMRYVNMEVDGGSDGGGSGRGRYVC